VLYTSTKKLASPRWCPPHNGTMHVDTYVMKKCLWSLSLAKLKQNSKEILKTFGLFTERRITLLIHFRKKSAKNISFFIHFHYNQLIFNSDYVQEKHRQIFLGFQTFAVLQIYVFFWAVPGVSTHRRTTQTNTQDRWIYIHNHLYTYTFFLLFTELNSVWRRTNFAGVASTT
jgi:hypothetical protein